MQPRPTVALAAIGVLCATATMVATGNATPAPAPVTAPAGSFAFSGEKAASFRMPADMRVLRSTKLPDGRTQVRYQQYADGTAVFNGQITIIRDRAGRPSTVIGAYYPGVAAKNTRALSAGKARAVVEKAIGARGRYGTSYFLNPRTGRTFYAVDVIRSESRPVRWVDAATGQVVKAFDAMAHEGTGTGVKGDTKTVDSTQNTQGQWELRSADGRKVTYDNQNRLATPVVMTDADNVWDLAGTKSPSQPAGVDAHYYADVVDDYYGDVFARNSIDGNGMVIKSRVHYNSRYCNATWNGEWMSYGDGDGRTCLPLSGGLDVVGHELTHGVTEHTSNLIYENESGALNEAFSDMIGNSIEFYAHAAGRDPAATPDWFIGEDVIISRTDPAPGFRNMADPGQDGDPDHVVDKYTGTQDGGGVHTNSGIPNHVYFLAIEGGQNRGCTASPWRSTPTHTEDCGVTVPALGLATAQQIFYDGFTSLVPWANFCDAREATQAAGAAYGAEAAIGLAWDAVGVHDGCTPGEQPPPPCEGDDTATIPFESPHPYGNDGDCTWTYDNGTGGFAFHFSLLDTEKDYDYVYVKDGNGTVLATYTGIYRRGATSPCISTSTGSVQLVTDPGVVDQGFIVDAVVPC